MVSICISISFLPVGGGRILGGRRGCDLLGRGGGVRREWVLDLGRMDRRIMVVVMVMVMVMAAVEVMVPVAALAATPPSIQPITCRLPSTSMISTIFCNSSDEQGMETQTKSCQGFLTMAEDSPSADCCRGLNRVAYNRTACICKLTFYPPASHNTSRQLDLPRLCGVPTNLCAQCPAFLTSISNSNGTNTHLQSPAKFSAPGCGCARHRSHPYHEKFASILVTNSCINSFHKLFASILLTNSSNYLPLTNFTSDP
ncbi:hypothetical protein KC19_5G044600 [Ceratodon purpureus]|uniref:Bifunctional inhibitor/plant lipid transfer protein/seed storage helical domain-containing protein n=1 Tax=Ceratodon purpureus TaxID=3225 RepID=A0A8T0HZ92_CERPU|nr:hypothetical protein KC19_5G044600 [Ceratodon purpureus]